MFSRIGRTFPSRRRALVLDVFWPPQLHDDCQALGDSRAQAIPLFVQHFLAIFGQFDEHSILEARTRKLLLALARQVFHNYILVLFKFPLLNAYCNTIYY